MTVNIRADNQGKMLTADKLGLTIGGGESETNVIIGEIPD